MLSAILNNFIKIYYYTAIFATVLFAFKLIIFMAVGSDSEVSSDFNTEFDADPSFDFLSIQSILAFLMGFGWMGYASLTQFKLNNLHSFFAAAVVGAIFMFVSAFLMFSVKKLEKNVKKDKSTAIGKVGKAYTNFDSDGNGKVEIEIAGQLTVADAFNMTDTPINAFDNVEVVEVKDNILRVVKLTKEENK